MNDRAGGSRSLRPPFALGIAALIVAACGSASPSVREPTRGNGPAPAEASSTPTEAPVARDAGSVSEPSDAGAPAQAVSDAAAATDVAPAAPSAAEALAAARSVLERHCDRCHGANGGRRARRHLDTSSASPGGHHVHELGRELRRVLGATGSRATMPPDAPGSVTGDDLAALLSWADAIEREHGAARANRHPTGRAPDPTERISPRERGSISGEKE